MKMKKKKKKICLNIWRNLDEYRILNLCRSAQKDFAAQLQKCHHKGDQLRVRVVLRRVPLPLLLAPGFRTVEESRRQGFRFQKLYDEFLMNTTFCRGTKSAKCAEGFRSTIAEMRTGVPYCWGVPSTGVPYSWGVPAKTKPDEMTENRIPFLSKSHVISLPGKCRVNYHSTTSTIDGLENPSSLLPIRKRFFVESRNRCFFIE
jgi:hypothetical protein